MISEFKKIQKNPLTRFCCHLQSPHMSLNLKSAEQIAQLKLEIAKLEQSAIQELLDRRSDLKKSLAAVEKEIAIAQDQLNPSKRRKMGKLTKKPDPTAYGKSVPLEELKEKLSFAPNKTVNIRKEGFNALSIRNLAKANPQLLRIGGKGPWPTVTLI